MVLIGRCSILPLFLSALRVQISVLPVIKGGGGGGVAKKKMTPCLINSYQVDDTMGVFPRSNNTDIFSVVLNDLLFVCCFCFRSIFENFWFFILFYFKLIFLNYFDIIVRYIF